MRVLIVVRLFALLAACGLALAPTPAAAWSPWAIDWAPESGGAGAGETSEEDPVLVEAQSEYQIASDAYALGKYEESIVHFERAYELSQEPALLFNLGQAYTRWYDLSNDLDHLKRARRMYENYVINLDQTDLDEEDRAHARADAQRRIAEVDRRIKDHEDADAKGPTDSAKPVHKKAWFWVAVVGGVAVVAGGITLGIVLGTRKDGFEPELGTIGQVPSPGGLTVRF